MDNAQLRVFSDILKQERRRRGWSQAYLAEKLGTDPNTVGRWERGSHTPNSYACRELCALLDMTLEELGLFNEQLADAPAPVPPPQAYVFLAYSQADSVFAHRLKGDLPSRNINVVGDHVEKKPGNLEEALRKDIRDVLAVILIASPNSYSARLVKAELQIAEMYKRPVLVLWIAGNELAKAVPSRWSGDPYIDAREMPYELTLAELVKAFKALPSVSSQAALPPKAHEPTFEPRNPYKGLHAFRGEDARDFFGRASFIDELAGELAKILAREKKDNGAARMLIIVGSSGSGKSSTVMAGVLPLLKAGKLPGSSEWVYLGPIVPGRHPIEALTLALEECLRDRSHKAIREDLEDESTRGLHLIATHLAEQPDTKVVLVVDQFEELFTLTASEQERKQFIDLLVTASTEPGGALLVILTLRADFYDRPLYYPELGQIIEKQGKLVYPMNVKELQAVIERPAALPDVQVTFEEGLVGDLLFEVQGQIGALPLLQFTLDQLFQRRTGHQLIREAYDEIGGVKGALSKHAEDTYAALPSEDHRRLAHALFLRLIFPGATEQDTTRRRAILSELSLEDATETRLLRETADAFVAARLLTTNEIAGITTIEVSHEALIREWVRLTNWLREARDDIALQQVLSADTAEWLRRGKPTDRLYRDTELAEAQTWMERNVPSKDEVEFLQASLAEQQLRQVEEQDRKARELTLQRRVVSRQRLLLAALSLFTVVVIILATVAEVGRQQADAQRQLADAQRRLAQIQTLIAGSRALAAQANNALLNNQVDRALLLSVKANETYNTHEAHDSLLAALQYSPRMLKMLRTRFAVLNPGSVYNTALTFSSDGQSLLSFVPGAGGFSWDTQTGASHRLPIPCPKVFDNPHVIQCSPLSYAVLPNGEGGIAVSPNGQMVASVSSKGSWVWNAMTGALIAQLELIPDCPLPNNSANNSQPFQCAIGNFTAIAFSPNGKILATSRCSQYSQFSCIQVQIYLWDVIAKKTLGRIVIQQAIVPVTLAFSPDSKILATSDTDGTVKLWDIASKTLVGRISTGDADLIADNSDVSLTSYSQEEDLAFSPDGKLLATVNANGAIVLWDVITEKPVESLTGAGRVEQLAFSPGGKILASGSDDNELRIWDVATGTLIGRPLAGHTQNITSLVFSPDGKMLASIDKSGTILLWNMVADSHLSQVLEYTNNREDGSSLLSSAVFSPDGNVAIAGNNSGKIILRDASTGKMLDTLDATMDPLTLPNTASRPPSDSNALTIESLTFNPDGRILVAGRFDGMIIFWDWTTKKPLMHFRLEKALRMTTYSPNGRLMASTYDSGDILLSNIATGKIVYRLTTHYSSNLQPSMSTVAFSKDGKILAAGNDNTVVLWNTATGKRIGQPLTGHIASVENVAFSPDGNIFASSDSSGTIILWDAHTWKIMNEPLSNNDLNFNFNLASAGLAFSPDGSMLASATTEFNGSTTDMFSVTVWNVASHEPVVHAFQEHQDQIADHYAMNGVLFSPDGKRLAMIVSSDPTVGHITLWSINIESWQALACSIADRNFTAAEWIQFENGVPYQKVCPNLPVDESVIFDYLDQAHNAALIGNIQDATTDYTLATRWAIDSGDADLSNEVCWVGSLDQFAKTVLPACDYAVNLDPKNVDYRDSRGLARALSGDIKGAIADYSFVVQPSNGYGSLNADQIRERKHWLDELKAGHNPFDAKTLAALQNSG